MNYLKLEKEIEKDKEGIDQVLKSIKKYRPKIREPSDVNDFRDKQKIIGLIKESEATIDKLNVEFRRMKYLVE